MPGLMTKSTTLMTEECSQNLHLVEAINQVTLTTHQVILAGTHARRTVPYISSTKKVTGCWYTPICHENDVRQTDR